jgi:PhnB protein
MPNKPTLPEGWHTITPSITVRNAAAAIDFYKRAFGAQETMRMNAPDGKIAHAELRIGDSTIMLNDEMDWGNCKSPQTLGGASGGLHIYVPDVDAAFDQAVTAGAQVRMPVADMFWGDRYGNVTDPFGHVWGLATHKEDLTPQQIEERAREFYAKMKTSAA